MGILTATATLIRIPMGAAIHIGTGIMVTDRRSTSGRHFIGTTVIAFIIRGTIATIITGAGSQLRQKIFEAGG